MIIRNKGLGLLSVAISSQPYHTPHMHGEAMAAEVVLHLERMAAQLPGVMEPESLMDLTAGQRPGAADPVMLMALMAARRPGVIPAIVMATAIIPPSMATDHLFIMVVAVPAKSRRRESQVSRQAP